jgi:hypothetical protein
MTACILWIKHPNWQEFEVADTGVGIAPCLEVPLYFDSNVSAAVRYAATGHQWELRDTTDTLIARSATL